jgi:hypothetical protein
MVARPSLIMKRRDPKMLRRNPKTLWDPKTLWE